VSLKATPELHRPARRSSILPDIACGVHLFINFGYRNIFAKARLSRRFGKITRDAIWPQEFSHSQAISLVEAFLTATWRSFISPFDERNIDRLKLELITVFTTLIPFDVLLLEYIVPMLFQRLRLFPQYPEFQEK
jgi:hypothetical protein